MLKFINQELDNFNGNVNEIRDVGDLLRKSYLFFITNIQSLKNDLGIILNCDTVEILAKHLNLFECLILYH
jgi:hypothetical protein